MADSPVLADAAESARALRRRAGLAAARPALRTLSVPEAPEVETPRDAGLERRAERARRAERIGRESRAQSEALRAIEMQGGEALRFLVGGQVRWGAIDAFGEVAERLPARTLEILAERGRLRLKRFGFGGEVWTIA